MMISFDYLYEKFKLTPNSCLHLGANSSQEAETYKRLGIKKVVWVDAIPKMVEESERHLKEVGCEEGATLICACVGEEEGKEVEFKISNNESQSSSYLDLGHHSIIHPSVVYIDKFKTKIQRVDNLFPPDYFKEGKWLLNADLQGSELQAFKGMGELLHDFDYVYSEINFKECYLGGALVEEIDSYLLQFGFSRVETGTVVGETWTDALYCKL